jgi:hypothetical protein
METSADLEAAIKKLSKERDFLQRKRYPGESIELETRIGVYQETGGTDQVKWINAYKKMREISKNNTWSRYAHRIVSTNNFSQFRRKEYENKVSEWQLKKSVSRENVYNLWTRVSLSVEARSMEPSHPKEQLMRYISRHSFYSDVTRVDFSRILTITEDLKANSEPTFEVEAEYIGTNSSRIKDYISTVMYLIMSMFNTPMPFTWDALVSMSSLANINLSSGYSDKIIGTKYINRLYLSEAITLGFDMLSYNNMFKSNDPKISSNKELCISLKTDGERMIFVACEKGTWLVFPPRQSALYAINESHYNIGITIIDGEFADGNFWIIDSLFLDGNDVRKKNYMTRYSMALEWVEKSHKSLFGGLIISGKEIAIANGVDADFFFDECKRLWKSQEKFKRDGIIFTPNDISYIEGTYVEKRQILKWKPEITIDFKIKKDHRGQVILYARDDNNKDIEFTGSDSIKFSKGNVRMRSIPDTSGTIVEFVCKEDSGEKILEAYRERPEKAGPNRISAAIDNWNKANIESMIISEQTLLCENSRLMRKYHNRIKKNLFFASKKLKKDDIVLLDIGSGRGGDLSKWKRSGYSKILCVEPDLENVKSFKERLAMSEYSSFRKRVHILEGIRGEDYEAITDFVKQHNNNEKVDVISMMDSLTFFFNPNSNSLDDLAKTIKNNLSDGGLFLWKMMDGDAVKNIFDKRGENKIDFYEDSIERVDEYSISPRIGTNVKGEIEYLTSVTLMKEKLGVNGETKSANEESLLRSEYALLSSLYKYGVFYLGSGIVYSEYVSYVFEDYENFMNSKDIETLADSAIEAVESIFTSKIHNKLLSSYWDVSKKIDETHQRKGQEPPYNKFETAYNAYFAVKFFNLNKIKITSEASVILDRSEKITDEESLAFASLLNLDVFIINENKKLLLTNSFVNSISPCIVVEKIEGKYKALKFLNSFVIQSSHKKIKMYERIKRPDIHRIYASTLNDAVEDVKNTFGKKYLFPKLTDTKTHTLNRIAYIQGVNDILVLLSLANSLAIAEYTECQSEDIINIGLRPNKKIIEYVNSYIKILNKAKYSK